MARKKTTTLRASVKAQVSARLKEVRLEVFGEHGGPELARQLNLPARTWYNYETGVTVPAEVLLGFIQQTHVDPGWLLTGQGAKYRDRAPVSKLDDLTPVQLIRLGLEILERKPQGQDDSARHATGFLSLDVRDLSVCCEETDSPSARLGRVLADRRWIPHPELTVAVRLDDDSMAPILAAGSIVAIDRTPQIPAELDGRLVAACVDGQALIRWFEISGKHVILRPNLPSRQFPSIPIELKHAGSEVIRGAVVWSWSRFESP